MKYNELKEMTFADWDGKPFYAIVTDYDEETLSFLNEGRHNGSIEGCLVTGYDE